MNDVERDRLIDLAREHAVSDGLVHAGAEVVQFVEHPDCAVIHFEKPEKTDPTGNYIIFESPYSIAVFVDRGTSRADIPNMYSPNTGK